MVQPTILRGSVPLADQTRQVLRNTYGLLSLTLLWSALTAWVAVGIGAPSLGFFTLIIFFGLLYAVHKTANSVWGLVWTFALTGFLGFSLAPLLTWTLGMEKGGALVAQSLAITAVAFLALSLYTVTTKRDFSFLRGFILVGVVIIVASWVASLFMTFTTLMHQVLAGICILLGAALILWETSAVVRGEEDNYIRATVGIYVGIYNIFSSVLLLFGLGGDD